MVKENKATDLDDLISEKELKDIEEVLDMVISDGTEELNKKAASEMEKIKRKEKKLLIDSPVDVTKMKSETKMTPIISEKLKTADEVRDSLKPKVRLINVNKTVSQILDIIADEINEHAEDRVVEIDFFDGEIAELLYAVRLCTVEKVIDRTEDFLQSKGYDTDVVINTYEGDDCDFNMEVHMTVEW